MAEVTASMVKELREKTDAPMMECKKALIEAEGNLTRAEEILRIKLGGKASKAASRATTEGLIGVFISPDNKQGAIVEVNCETDFVAKNNDFIRFINQLAQLIILKKPADVESLATLPLGTGTVESERSALIGKIGENISIRRFEWIETQDKLASYVHGNKIGVLVEYNGDEVLGKDLAMHIAAAKPKALNAAGISPDEIASERVIAQEKAIESGKPPEIVTKMVEGAVAKYLAEVALLSQIFVKNDKQSIEQLLKEKGGKIAHYVLYLVGAGIEKKAHDFAAEVAATVAGRS